METKKDTVLRLYQRLAQKHGAAEKYWPGWCATKRPRKLLEEILMGTILVQRTSWHNADIALKNLLRADLLSVQRIAKLVNREALIDLIRPAGFFRSKPQRLIDVCKYIASHGGFGGLMKRAVGEIRKELLTIKGVGPETADTILCYVLDKPSFIVDEYTRRLVKKCSLADNLEYDYVKNLFERSLPSDARVYRDFHALIIVDQKGADRARMEVLTC